MTTTPKSTAEHTALIAVERCLDRTRQTRNFRQNGAHRKALMHCKKADSFDTHQPIITTNALTKYGRFVLSP